MEMISRSADGEQGGLPVPDNPPDIGIESPLNLIRDRRDAILGAEYDVNGHAGK